MRIKLLILAALLPMFVLAQAETKQPKKVAVWETQRTDDGISLTKATLVRGAIEEAVDNTPGYVKYDRAMFDAIVAEQKFQRSGAVKDEDMRRLGVMAGVQYVIVPECAIDEGFFVLNVRMLDVESGQSKTVQEVPANSIPEIKAACTKLSERLFGGKPTIPLKNEPIIYNFRKSGKGTFIECYDLKEAPATFTFSWNLCSVCTMVIVKDEDGIELGRYGIDSPKGDGRGTVYSDHRGSTTLTSQTRKVCITSVMNNCSADCTIKK